MLTGIINYILTEGVKPWCNNKGLGDNYQQLKYLHFKLHERKQKYYTRQ